MKILGRIASVICAINAVVGTILSWLSVGIVLVCFTVVVQRYVFAVSHVWMQDLYIWMNGAMFTGVAGFALLRDNHVRVDIFYRPATPRKKAVIDLVGVLLFLMPAMYVVWIYALPFVQRSWRYGEGSANVGGMPALFVLKTFILAFAVLIALQGLAMILRSILMLAGREDLVPARIRYTRAEDPTHPTEAV
ncbi:TRAP-type mannitol/chloroaromatic compound transport system permease small subunit [Sagittula marina]|uniref:TRAP transporter small permease protein n=1 Tax=Sagittula marina TaxID=943940 RepID=A0A7W6DRY0_9RHOB|nr:TRAP transporter small permease subunit [Sagittula marina]MBB3985782.1 TRAP-type mannitol/chloroaromatic compound transport system permease small subunit [Sagittula marina]